MEFREALCMSHNWATAGSSGGAASGGHVMSAAAPVPDVQEDALVIFLTACNLLGYEVALREVGYDNLEDLVIMATSVTFVANVMKDTELPEGVAQQLRDALLLMSPDEEHVEDGAPSDAGHGGDTD